MAGYVKIWTTLRNNTEFLSLSMSQRGMYLQLILACKEQRDDGTVCFRNVAGLGSACSCERSTAGKTLRILAEKSLLTYTQNNTGVLTIILPNYKHWQDIDVGKVREKSRKISGKIPPPILDQPNLDQPIHSPAKLPVVSTTNPDHSKAVKYFCDTYLEKYKVKYLFADRKDGAIIKRLLATFGFDFFCRLVDQIHVTNDEFIVSKGKVTLGVLSACANKLTQEIMGQHDLRLKFSEKERQALTNIAEGLGLK